MAEKRKRSFGKVSARRDAAPAGPHPMIGVKLWNNPCRLSFRVNFIAHHFNQPLYEWIWREYRLTMPEHIVLYALALKDGITADDIAASTARPKNTLSRGVNAVLRKKLIERRADPRDRRRLILTLTARGRRIVARTVPAFVGHEDGMASALTAAERRTLESLLEKIILDKPNWPTQIQGRS
ncbi:MAG: winged helix-turn-helix transcriptional regulator [Proteobacteria bacterium]|nr:winged helix-turn-helix transcriptional regulator [Pseudomonadota bacterium]